MDIVERLREANGDFYAHERKEIVLEAADEIERHRAEVERLTRHLKGIEIALARDENVDGAIQITRAALATDGKGE